MTLRFPAPVDFAAAIVRRPDPAIYSDADVLDACNAVLSQTRVGVDRNMAGLLRAAIIAGRENRAVL